MVINRIPLLVIFILFITTVYGLFYVKEKVVNMRSELHEIKRQINNENNSIRILRAEFAYLSSPKRLARLNENYLHLSVTDTKQIVSALGDDAIDVNSNKNTKSKILASSSIDNNVKWRYKKGPEKYITRVSGKN